MKRLAEVLLLTLLAGCAQMSETGKSMHTFEPKQLAKSDIDRIADAHRREVFFSLRVLTEKLYRRNPREWKKSGYASREAALNHLLDPRTSWRLPELGQKQGTEAILLALSTDYQGDRVAAFIAGTGSMLNAAFDEKTEFFMFDSLEPQKLYNSARNLEIAAWKLANARDTSGNLLLLTNDMATPQQPANLSFEREFGKMIGNLDLLSHLIADRGNRTIVHVTHSLATAVFLPVMAIK
ncbi:MAG: hypothetical protein Q7J21_11675 [Rugosibacter sp.]|nr:hypothetical protein [Rugosibacter sp.]